MTITLDQESEQMVIAILRSEVYELLIKFREANKNMHEAEMAYRHAVDMVQVVRGEIEAICEFLNQANPEALDHDEPTWQDHIGLHKK